MSKIQAKSTNSFSFFRLLNFHLLLGLMVTIIVATQYNTPTKSSNQQTSEASAEADVQIFTPSLLPTQPPITPAVLPLHPMELLHPPQIAASQSAKPTDEDFCLHVPVLMYHHIQPLQMASLLGHKQLTVDSAIFEGHIKYLKQNGYQALTAKTLINALVNREQLPEKSILITIDDGYDDNYTYAFMTAKKYQFVMNFMIPTKLINKPGYMNWDHLREMHSNEYAAIYNHTATHAPLGYILKSEIEKELTTSTEDFKNELGIDVNIFTYPYGSYTPVAIDVLKNKGFVGAFTTEDGQTQCLSQIMTLKRTRVGNAPLPSYGF